MKDFIPYGRQDISQDDIEAVIKVLRSDWLTQGPLIPEFERKVASYCGAKYAVALSSATAALHVSCLSMRLGKGDRLWTSPNTFVASSNCGLYCGAEVDFVDIDPRTFNISIDALKEKLKLAEKNGLLPKIIVPVHFAGQSCLMDQLFDLSKKYGFKILEDGAHAIGGTFEGSKIGSCKYSEATVFSFHPVKLVTTGEGGVIVTNNQELYDTAIRLRSHGITRDQRFLADRNQGAWYYEQLDLGFHYRITDLQAGLGISQLERLDIFVKHRQELASRYDKLLADFPLTTPWQHPLTKSPFHLYVVSLDLKKIGKSYGEVFSEMRNKGIGVNLHYMPVYLQPYYRELGFRPGYCSNAEEYFKKAITLPLYYGLTHELQDRVVKSLKEVICAK